MNVKKRISVLGLCKFLAAVGIVFLHCLPSRGHWLSLYLLVEFFFMITGYFTFKHFQKTKTIQVDTLDIKSRKAIKYTINKFIPFLPFIFIAVLIRYTHAFIVVGGGGLPEIIRVGKNAIMDLLLLNSQTGEYGWVLWFLSAMFIVFPLFSLVCQSKNKNFLYIIIALSSIIYYFNFFNSNIYGVYPLVRAFMGLSLGILVYAISENIKTMKTSSNIITSVWVFCILCSLALLYIDPTSPNMNVFRPTIILLFIIILSILLSMKMRITSLSIKAFDYLEKISLVLFLMHAPILFIFESTPIANHRKLLFLIVLSTSFITSVIVYFSVNKIQKHLKQKHNNN